MAPQTNVSKPRRPSLSGIVAVTALVIAMGGTAIAAPDALRKLDAKEVKQVKKVAKKEANKRIDARAGGLSVASASSATSATTAETAETANAVAPGSVKAGSLGTIEQRQVTESIADGTGESATATCEAGEVMLSGGTSTAGVGTDAGWTTIRSGPDPSGWTAAAFNDTGAAASLIVEVVCLAP